MPMQGVSIPSCDVPEGSWIPVQTPDGMEARQVKAKHVDTVQRITYFAFTDGTAFAWAFDAPVLVLVEP